MSLFRFGIRIFLLIIASLVASVTAAQDLGDVFEQITEPWLHPQTTDRSNDQEEPIETDRDSFTPATTTVNRGRLIYESSYSFIENRQTASDNSFPEIITRIGLTERLELRIGWNYEVGGGGEVSNGDPGGQLEEPGIRRDSQMLYGFKYSLTKQNGWMPQSAGIVQVTTPTSGPNSATTMNFAYVWGWKLPNNWQLDSSFRYVPAKEDGDHFNQWAPSIVFKVPVMERWAMHTEYFGVFTDGKMTGTNRQYVSPGIHYLITPNCEVGVRVGWGLNQEAANFFSNVGFGYRF